MSFFSDQCVKFGGPTTKVQYSEISSEDEKVGQMDVMIFPDNVKYLGVSKDHIVPLLEDILGKGITSEVVPHQKLSKRAHILVCAHKLRDKRCGVAGPLLIGEFSKYLAEKKLEDQVEVAAISHVGGHAFAGNVIIYPEGVWYGRVTPCHVHVIVEEHILKHRVVETLLRGKIDLEKEK